MEGERVRPAYTFIKTTAILSFIISLLVLASNVFLVVKNTHLQHLIEEEHEFKALKGYDDYFKILINSIDRLERIKHQAIESTQCKQVYAPKTQPSQAPPDRPEILQEKKPICKETGTDPIDPIDSQKSQEQADNVYVLSTLDNANKIYIKLDNVERLPLNPIKQPRRSIRQILSDAMHVDKFSKNLKGSGNPHPVPSIDNPKPHNPAPEIRFENPQPGTSATLTHEEPAVERAQQQLQIEYRPHTEPVKTPEIVELPTDQQEFSDSDLEAIKVLSDSEAHDYLELGDSCEDVVSSVLQDLFHGEIGMEAGRIPTNSLNDPTDDSSSTPKIINVMPKDEEKEKESVDFDKPTVPIPLWVDGESLSMHGLSIAPEPGSAAGGPQIAGTSTPKDGTSGTIQRPARPTTLPLPFTPLTKADLGLTLLPSTLYMPYKPVETLGDMETEGEEPGVEEAEEALEQS